MTRIRASFSTDLLGDGSTVTEGAVLGLIGQEPMLTEEGSWKGGLGRARVVAAYLSGDRVHVDLEVHEKAAEIVKVDADPLRLSVGFTYSALPDAPPSVVSALDLLQVMPERLPAVPAFPTREEITMPADRTHEHRPGPAAPQGDPQPPPLEDQPREDEVLLERTTEVVPEEPVEAAVESVRPDLEEDFRALSADLEEDRSRADWQVQPEREPSPHVATAEFLLRSSDLAGERTPEGALAYAAQAQVHATLALVDAVHRLADITQAR